MTKENKNTETLDENLFGGFKFINEEVPMSVNNDEKTDEKEIKEVEENKTNSDIIKEDEKKTLDEIKQVSDKKARKKEEELKEETQEEEENQEEETEEPNESEFSIYAKHMAEKGILELDENDKVETEEDLEEIQSKTIIKRIQDWKSKYDEDTQKYLEFVENGGNPSDFHKYYYADGSFENFDITSEQNQKYVIKEALKFEGFSDEEIEDEINDTLDIGKLEKKANIYLKKLQKIEKEQKDILIQSQKEYAEKVEQQRKQEWDGFKKGLFDKEEIGGFNFTPKMKTDTWDYMTKVINKKTGETQYQIDSKENPDARYIFAYLLKNKWDAKSLEKQVTTKAVSKLKSKLSNYTDSRNKIKSGRSEEHDLKNESSFAGFRTLINQ